MVYSTSGGSYAFLFLFLLYPNCDLLVWDESRQNIFIKILETVQKQSTVDYDLN